MTDSTSLRGEAVFAPRMRPNEAGRLNAGRTVVLSLSFFSVLLAWSYFNIKVPLLLEEILPAFPAKDLVKGAIMALDNLLAILLQPAIGAMSDRTASRFGRRMPYIVAGTALASFFFVLMPFARAIAGLVLVIFFFDLAMSIFRTPALAILADYTADEMRPKGSAIQQFIANLGGVVGFLIPMVASRLPLPGALKDASGFILCSLFILAAVGVQALLLRETRTGIGVFALSKRGFAFDSTSFSVMPADAAESGTVAAGSSPRASSAPDVAADRPSIVALLRGDPSIRNFLLAVTCWYLGFAAVEAFFSSFAIAFLGKASDSEASSLFIAYPISMIASAYFVGLVGQRIGRKRALVLFESVLVGTLALMSLVIVPLARGGGRDLLLMGGLVLVAVPWMGVIVNSFPLLWTLTPPDRLGAYTGIYYTFNQSAYTASPVILGAILSLASGMGRDRYLLMFPFVLVVMILGLVFTLAVREPGAS